MKTQALRRVKKLSQKGKVKGIYFKNCLTCFWSACYVSVTVPKHIVGICGQDALAPCYLETYILVTYRQAHK